MYKYPVIVILLLLLVFSNSSSQVRFDNWQTYSSMYSASGATFDNAGNLWGATSGGVFRYNTVNKEFTEYRNVGALLTLDITSIFYKPDNNTIIAGSIDGVINIYSEQTGTWQHITDIQNQTTLTKKRINAFASTGKRLFVGGDFGMVEYDSNNVPKDFVQQMGDFPRGTTVTQLTVFNDSLWATTPIGVARISLKELSLRNPIAWRTIAWTTGLLEENCVGASFYNGAIYIASKHSIVKYDNGNFTTISSGLSDVNAISVNKDGVFYSTQFFLVSVATGNWSVQSPALITGHTLVSSNNLERRIVFFDNASLGIYDGNTLELVTPQTPLSNQFASLVCDNSGNVWCATADRDGNSGKGLTVLTKEGWKNYLPGSEPPIITNGYIYTYKANDGAIWIGSWGGGILRATVSDKGFDFVNFRDTGTAMSGQQGAPGYIVTGKAASDKNGAIWITNYSESTSGNVIACRTAQGEWFGFTNGAGTSRQYKSVVVDQSGTKWMASIGAGLLAFNENGTLADKSDDFWRLVTTSDVNILSDIQNALAVDKNGALWIGTPVGLAVIYNPSSILRGTTLSVQRPASLANLTINDIYVDPQNNKWIATNNGVFVLNEDGTQVLATLSKSDTTPLVSNQIISIALNESDGNMYFGSKEGLSRASTLAVQPLPEYNVNVYPQPYYPEKDGDLVIDGLAAEAKIRIVSPSGQAIRSIDTRSRRALWDGRDEQGNLVSSGVYIILATSATGGKAETGAGKIAVIRKQ